MFMHIYVLLAVEGDGAERVAEPEYVCLREMLHRGDGHLPSFGCWVLGLRIYIKMSMLIIYPPWGGAATRTPTLGGLNAWCFIFNV